MCTLSDMISASSERMMPCMDNHLQLKSQSPSSSSSRILDIPCKVCGDYSSGKHYNIFACDGCAGFFKRSIRRNRKYQCKAKEEGTCVIDKTHRNQCRACRLHKCQEAGMNKDAVQHERGPRNSTLRKQQMSNCYGEFRDRILMTPQGVLNLTLPKPASPTPRIDTSFPMIPPSSYINNGLLSMSRLPTVVPLSPIIPSPFLTPTAICEYAARLLFTNVQWARSLASFTSLPFSDQLLLLEESWRELFVLGAAQFLPLVELSSLVHACGILERDDENPTLFLHKVKEFQDILASVRMYQLDHHEYSCLRAIMLFKTQFDKASSSASSPPQAETKVLTEPSKIATIQDDTQLSLNKHIQSLHPGQPLRFGKLLMLLPTLRSVQADTIEELFFRKTIGNIPISKIICDMYKSQAISVS